MIKKSVSDSQCFAGKSFQLSVILAVIIAWPTYSHAQPDDGITDLTVTVESGDTFSQIISRELQSLDAWQEVADHNKLNAPDSLRPGDVIVIPAEVLRRRNYAKVVFVKGKATHLSSSLNSQKPVTKGAKVYAGDIIKTDPQGFVSLTFNGESSVNIQPDSTMRINIIRCIDIEESCEIGLESENGQLRFDVQSVGFKKPTTFTIKSPFASAAVRGTRFDFDINDGNVLGVTEGVVEISLNGASNNVGKGKGVLAGEGRSINDLIDLLEQPALRLDLDVNRISKEDSVSWNKVQGAENYLLAFAGGESMQDVVASVGETDNFTVPKLAAGDYFVSARATDINGLRGFVSKKKISVVKVDEQVAAPELDIVLADSEMRLSAPDAGQHLVEVKIGNRLGAADGQEFLIATSAYQIRAGQTVTVPIDTSKDWYMQGRKVISGTTVSPYSFLYVFDKAGQ